MQRWQTLHDAWWRLATQSRPHAFSNVLVSSALSAGSLPYEAVVRLRNGAYDRGLLRSVRVPCRVISVGNLTVGGTGKTACVELIANKLRARDKPIAVLSRGYGGSTRDYWLKWEGNRLLVNGQEGICENGLADEPQLLAQHLERVPIIVGSRRARTGSLACAQFGAEAVVLDDGFQHRSLHRDLDIVLVHATMPFDGWNLLPRGPMREPLSSLKRAQVIIITKADEALERIGALTERLRAFNPEAIFATAVHEPSWVLDPSSGTRQAPSRLQGARVGLLSSIGDPAGFETTVRRLHATVLWHQTFPDHHPYVPEDWASLERHRGLSLDAIVTTEKDWVRLRSTIQHSRFTSPLWILGVQMKLLTGEAALDDRLARLFLR